MDEKNYSIYAKYYDVLNTDYSLWHHIIKNNIPKADMTKKIIEFGCGTGNILKRYAKSFSVYGVDLSNEMLVQAKEKIPKGTFFCEDMVSFSTQEKFDIALCLFDTINHVLDFSKWQVFFQNVASSLTSNGVFILDTNTTQRLKLITTYPPMCKEFDNNYFFMKLLQENETNFLFDVRILLKTDEELYREEKEIIEETTRTGEEVYMLLSHYFSDIIVFNDKNEFISKNKFKENEKNRWFYICRV